MRYLLLLVVLVVLVWHWRTNRKADIAQRQQKPTETLIDMVECAHCHLHLAAADSVHGKKGVYCSPGHRGLAER